MVVSGAFGGWWRVKLGTEAPGSDHNLWEAGNHGQEVFGNVRLAAGFVCFFIC